MCDEFTEKDNEDYERKGGTLNRRDFSKLSLSAIATLCYGGLANASALFENELVESDVSITMADGVSDSFFVHPKEGKHPGILMWPDIRGLRPAFKAMAKRLAAEGYAVLVVNQFYRDAKAPITAEGEQFSEPAVRTKIMPMY